MKLSPYLMFDGQCEAAFQFYAQCLGGKIGAMMTNGESPMADQTPPERLNAIVHASLHLGDMLLMGSDCPPDYYRTPQGSAVWFSVTDPAEAERIFSALAESGTVQMPMEQTFWAVRFGMCMDRFGTNWMISCDQAA